MQKRSHLPDKMCSMPSFLHRRKQKKSDSKDKFAHTLPALRDKTNHVAVHHMKTKDTTRQKGITRLDFVTTCLEISFPESSWYPNLEEIPLIFVANYREDIRERLLRNRNY